MKRYTGSGFSDVSGRKRWNGTSWVALTVGKRWNGSAWVDLWSSSSGGSGTTGNGTVSKISSTVSSPTVSYAATYTYSVSGSSLSLPVTFAAWISSASRLGSGIRLTVYARLNGGPWSPAVVKSNGDVWQNSSAKHYASVTLSGTAKSTNTIEWYVTRSGSSYSGTAGNLGSSVKPKKHTFGL